MKAIVDPNLCIGCTQCAGLCPEVFSMDGTLAVAIPGRWPWPSPATSPARTCPRPSPPPKPAR